MKFLKIILLLFLIVLNTIYIRVYGFQVHIIKYRNLLCNDDPLFITTTTNCSNMGYFQQAADFKLAITNVDTIKDCTTGNKEISKFVETNKCYLNSDGTSFQYIISELELPRTMDTFCNEVIYIDCIHYYMNSFRNNTCSKHINSTTSSNVISNIFEESTFSSTIYQRKECSLNGSTINIYHCKTDKCGEDCVLVQSYSSNISNCENFQPLKVLGFFSNTTNTVKNDTFNSSNETKLYTFDSSNSSKTIVISKFNNLFILITLLFLFIIF